MPRKLAAAAGLAVLLSACGGGGGGGVGNGGGGDSRLLHAQPDELIFDASASVENTTFHVRWEMQDSAGTIVLDADVDAGGNLKGTLLFHGSTGAVAIVDDRLFVQGAAVASVGLPPPPNAGTWLRLTRRPLGDYDTIRHGRLLGQCIHDLGGTETVMGRVSMGGRDTVEVDGAGDAQGGAADKVYLSLASPPRLVRLWVAGSGQAPPDSCNGGQPGQSGNDAPSGTMDFSNFGEDVTIHPPAGAIDATG